MDNCSSMQKKEPVVRTQQPVVLSNPTRVYDYLRWAVEQRSPVTGWKYSCFEAYVLSNGQHFAYQPFPAQYRGHRGRLKQCFANAYRLAREHPELSYAEGYASETGHIGFLHAWCVHAEGRVVDPTWDFRADYYGVIFDTNYVAYVNGLRGEHNSVIDNWTQQWPLLRGDPPATVQLPDESIDRNKTQRSR